MLVIKVEIEVFNVERVFVDAGSSMKIMFLECFRKMKLTMEVKWVGTSLFGIYMISCSSKWKDGSSYGIRIRYMDSDPNHYFYASGRAIKIQCNHGKTIIKLVRRHYLSYSLNDEISN